RVGLLRKNVLPLLVQRDDAGLESPFGRAATANEYAAAPSLGGGRSCLGRRQWNDSRGDAQQRLRLQVRLTLDLAKRLDRVHDVDRGTNERQRARYRLHRLPRLGHQPRLLGNASASPRANIVSCLLK